jgi:hypothetical protein
MRREEVQSAVIVCHGISVCNVSIMISQMHQMVILDFQFHDSIKVLWRCLVAPSIRYWHANELRGWSFMSDEVYFQ